MYTLSPRLWQASTSRLKSARGEGLFWMGIQSSWNMMVLTPAALRESSASPTRPSGKARLELPHSLSELAPTPATTAWAERVSLQSASQGFTGVTWSPKVMVDGSWRGVSVMRMRSIVSFSPGSTSMVRLASAGWRLREVSQNQHRPAFSFPSQT